MSGRFGRALRLLPAAPRTTDSRPAKADVPGGAIAVRRAPYPPPATRGRAPPLPAGDASHFAALSSRGTNPLRRPAPANVTDSKINLGAGDWTVECWLWLDSGATAEGVILELGAGPRGTNALVTRLGLRPFERTFCLSGLGPVSDQPNAPLAQRVEYANPEGPPGGVARLFTATLTANQPLPRDRWFHAAVVHTSADELRLYLDGRFAAMTSVQMLALPHGDEAYLAVGGDGRSERLFPGMIDELRVSDAALYRADFLPPTGFPAPTLQSAPDHPGGQR